MNSALVKASKAIKDSTSTGRMIIDALNRAQEIYLGQIKRAEAELIERIKAIFAKAAGDDETTPEAVNGAEATAPQPASTPPV